jgi:hypothetical protein
MSKFNTFRLVLLFICLVTIILGLRGVGSSAAGLIVGSLLTIGWLAEEIYNYSKDPIGRSAGKRTVFGKRRL